MIRLLALLGSLSLVSCFPAYQAELPNVQVSAVDQNTGLPVTAGKIKYASIPSYRLPDTKLPKEVEFTSIDIQGETTKIEGSGSFGIFWTMQSPLPSTMKLKVVAPNYAPYNNTLNTTTHGAFGPFNITEVVRLKPLHP